MRTHGPVPSFGEQIKDPRTLQLALLLCRVNAKVGLIKKKCVGRVGLGSGAPAEDLQSPLRCVAVFWGGVLPLTREVQKVR